MAAAIQFLIARLGLTLLSALVFAGAAAAQSGGAVRSQTPRYAISAEDGGFLEDLSQRSFMFFWEQADPETGIVRDRSGRDGGPSKNERSREIGSIASVGFGLSGMCIAAERGWLPREAVIERARRTLRFFAERSEQQHGWFYHFVDLHSGARAWQSELSSIDTALLVAGALTARQCFSGDPEVPRLAGAIYRRIDFQWMLAGDPLLLSHGWKPEQGFLNGRWDHQDELMILYGLAISSPTHPIPVDSWYAWKRPEVEFAGYRYIAGASPLFVHQYAQAWIDFRGWRERRNPATNWFDNSVLATRAHKAFCLSLASEFPGYTENVWGITASDSRKGYVAWGGPPRHKAIDGTVVPAAAGGSLMFAPDITIPALRDMYRKFGDRVYGRYGFADAFHPVDGWVDPDVIGIDLGITLLSAENLRTGRVWRWFMRNPEIIRGMRRVRAAHPSPDGSDASAARIRAEGRSHDESPPQGRWLDAGATSGSLIVSPSVVRNASMSSGSTVRAGSSRSTFIPGRRPTAKPRRTSSQCVRTINEASASSANPTATLSGPRADRPDPAGAHSDVLQPGKQSCAGRPGRLDQSVVSNDSEHFSHDGRAERIVLTRRALTSPRSIDSLSNASARPVPSPRIALASAKR